ncbi:MAG: signal peptidase I [Erysipelotrichaceae bacterium]|nr:signal peptidase I [Erysipelotrichaceae bacterium]
MKEKYKEILSYIIIIVVVLLIKHYVITPIKVNGNSMNNTLKNKDIMILDKISYRFQEIERFDIVVIKKGNDYLIKRVIGMPGETVEYKNNKLYINGKNIDEKFIHEKTNDFIMEEKIPDDCYFVVGDNRPVSNDSRYIGVINKKDILGKTSLVIFPFSRFGIKK